MLSARWQGVVALFLLIIISYIDRVNISVLVLNAEFSSHFHLAGNRVAQGMLMSCFF